MVSIQTHVEAIERLCSVCGNIIMKNSHKVDDRQFGMMKDLFKTDVTIVEGVTPNKLCHSCWRTIRRSKEKANQGIAYRTTTVPLV